MMHILQIVGAIKKMIIKELKHFSFENHYKQTGFTKENSYYSMKHKKEKKTFVKNKKSVKGSKIITQQHKISYYRTTKKFLAD